jgi:hypothetical protein
VNLGFTRKHSKTPFGIKKSATALFAGVSLFAAGLATYSVLQAGDPVQVNLSAFNWLASLKLDLAQPMPPIEIKAEPPIVFAPIPESQASLAVAAPVYKSHRASRARHAARKIARSANDAIRSVAAAPVQPEYIDGVATQAQLDKFKSLNSLLRQQFFAAVDGRVLAPTEQFAAIDSDAAVAVAALQDDYSVKVVAKPAHKKHARRAPVTTQADRVPAQVAEVLALPTPEPTFYSKLAQVSLAGYNSMAVTAYDAPIGPQPLAIEVSRRPVLPMNTQAETIADQVALGQAAPNSETQATSEQDSESGAANEGSTADDVASSESPDAGAASQNAALNQSAAVTIQGGMTGSFQQAWSNLGKTVGASNVGYSGLNTQSGNLVSTTHNPNFDVVRDWPKYESEPPHAMMSAMVQNNGERGWKLARAEDRWPTLVDHTLSPAPMIANNTAMMLAARQKVVLQSDTGIVFGKLPAGWSIKISGRAERPLFLSAENLFVGPEVVQGERYFIYLNAAPGTQILGLVGPNGIDGGVLTIPVLNHTATYADFTRQARNALTGVLVYADSGEHLANAKVQIMGQPGSATWTNARGEFSIPQVLAVGNLPVHVDVERAETRTSGKAHVQRFRVYGSAMKDVPLFVLHEGQIRDWLGQLQGRINSDTGMIVGGFKDLASARLLAHKKLRPLIEPFSFNANPAPETYVVSDEGQLQVGTALGPKDSVFLGLEIADGPVMAKIVADGLLTTWSDIVYSESNTVNVIYNAP